MTIWKGQLNESQQCSYILHEHLWGKCAVIVSQPVICHSKCCYPLCCDIISTAVICYPVFSILSSPLMNFQTNYIRHIFHILRLAIGKYSLTYYIIYHSKILVRAECMRQRNVVAIILGIISPPPPLSSGLTAISRLGLWLADDFKGKPPHWLPGVKSVWGA